MKEIFAESDNIRVKLHYDLLEISVNINMTERRNYMKSENFYDIEDIQEILGIGRNAAYSFVQKAYKEKTPFRVIKIGKLYRITKVSFDKRISEE